MSSPVRILIADDSLPMRVMVRGYLEQQMPGAVFDEAHDGAQALERIGTTAPDVVVLDLEMPILSGLEVLEQLRAVGNRVPVVVFTSSPSERVEAARALGADLVVGKPGVQFLHRALTTVLEGV